MMVGREAGVGWGGEVSERDKLLLGPSRSFGHFLLPFTTLGVHLFLALFLSRSFGEKLLADFSSRSGFRLLFLRDSTREKAFGEGGGDSATWRNVLRSL